MLIKRPLCSYFMWNINISLTGLPLFLTIRTNQLIFISTSTLSISFSHVENGGGGGTLNPRNDNVVFTDEVHDGNGGNQGFELMNDRHSSSSGVDIPDNFHYDEGEENVVLDAGQSVATMFHSFKMRMTGLVVLGVISFLLLLTGIGGIISYNKKVTTMKSVSLSDPTDCPESPDRHLESLTWGRENGEYEADQTHLKKKTISNANVDTNKRNLVSSTPNNNETE